MKLISWGAGIVGIVIALVGFLGGMRRVYVMEMFGSRHAPSTFLVLGILFLAIGIWASVLNLQSKNK